MSIDRIRIVSETGSTNADLRALAAEWPEGQWLRAERQTAGRGRLGREWRGSLGNLHASTLIRLRADDPPVASLGLMVGVAVHATLANFIPDAAIQLKWPNDVMCGPAKLSGMLLERDGDCIIAGVGLNVAAAPALPDRQTIAVADLPGGAGVNAQMVLEALVVAFDHWLSAWRQGGARTIIAAWLPRSHPPGTRLSVSTGADQPLLGHFVGLDPDGALILGREDGTETIVHSGDVGLL